MKHVTIPQTRAEARALERAQTTTAPRTARGQRLPGTRYREPAWGGGAAVSLGVLVGVFGALVGIAPWLLTGANLPLQNLWGTHTAPESMPVALLPISQYNARDIAIMLVVGALIAGFGAWGAARITRESLRWGALAGLVLAYAVIIVQSFLVTAEGLRNDESAQIYVAGLLGGTLISAVIGVGIFYLASARTPVLRALAVGALAVPLGAWPLVFARTSLVGEFSITDVPWLQWMPGVIAGLALAWLGWRSGAAVLVWVLTLAFLWFLPAVFSAIQSALGNRVILGDFSAMIANASRAFGHTILPNELNVANVIVAVVIGVLGAVGLAVLERRRTSAG